MQKEAVMATEGPLLLLAGAGSGKTTVLINRIANLIRFGRGSDTNEVPDTATEEDVVFLENLQQPLSEFDKRRADYLCAVEPPAPWNIIAITFTNKAANELKDRLSRILETGAQDVWAMTFHSACCRILRREIERLGYSRSFTIYDTADSERLMKDIINSTVFAVAQSEARPILTGELFMIENRTLTVVALDNFRLAIREEKNCVFDNDNRFSFVVPGKALSDLAKLLDDDDGIFGFFCKANANNAVHALRMALAADIVAGGAARFGKLTLAAQGAGHGLVLGEILQGSLTDETFFLHGGSSLVVFTQYTTSFGKREWGTFFAETPCNTGLFPL